jgi:hypothetical protein
MRKNPYSNPTPAYRGNTPPEPPPVNTAAVERIIGQLMKPSGLERGERYTRAPQTAHHTASLRRRDE